MENQNNPKSPNGDPTTSQQQWKQLEAERRDWERRKAERGLDDLNDQSDFDAWRDVTGTQDAPQTAEANDATGSDSDAFERARAEGEYILETGNYPQAESEKLKDTPNDLEALNRENEALKKERETLQAESADLQARLDALEKRLKQLEGGNSGNKPDGENRPKHLKAGESWDNNPPEDEEGASPEAESAPDNTGANVATGSDSDAFDQARFDYIAETGTDPWAEPEEPEAESALDNAGDGVEDKVSNDQEPEPEQKTGDDAGADQNMGEGNGNVPGGEDNNNSPEGEQPKTDNAEDALQPEWSAEADGSAYPVDDAEGEPKNPNTAIVPFSGGGVPAKVGGGTKKSLQDLGPAIAKKEVSPYDPESPLYNSVNPDQPYLFDTKNIAGSQPETAKQPVKLTDAAWSFKRVLQGLKNLLGLGGSGEMSERQKAEIAKLAENKKKAKQANALSGYAATQAQRAAEIVRATRERTEQAARNRADAATKDAQNAQAQLEQAQGELDAANKNNTAYPVDEAEGAGVESNSEERAAEENTAGNTDNDVNMAEQNGMTMIPDAELDRMYDDPNLDAETRAQVEAEYDRRTAPTVETGSAGTPAETPVTPINNSATPPPMAA